MVGITKAIRNLVLCGFAAAAPAFGQANQPKTMVMYPSAFASSQAMSELPVEQPLYSVQEIPEPGPGPLRSKIGSEQQRDSALQTEIQPMVSATQGVDFEGIFTSQYVPSDSNLAVGPNHIVEVVNVQFAVYSKSGAALAGPTDIQALFNPLGGVCACTDGDPVVLYDRPADRWLISFIGTTVAGSTGAECVAVSKTNDPTGAYYLYGYSFGSNLNDYPKLSTWATASNSAYLASYNIFQNFSNFIGAELCGFDRSKMLAGNSTAAQLCQITPASEFGYLPSDLDGPSTPTDGTPGLFISWYNNNPGQLYLRKLTLNFASATATLSAPSVISVGNTNITCGGSGGTCVPQLGTTQALDSLGDRLMYRFAIRHFSDHDRAVVNHSVASGTQIGIRWYELYDPAGTVILHQQGTFAPADGTSRWMASLAEDDNGDIGLGYSASSSLIYPGIRFTGRVPSDTVGTMETEANILTGSGAQTGSYSNRWGDYTAMQVDPSDDCTFWYVNQYEQATGVFNWHTNIASFAFSGCTGGGGVGPTVSVTPTSLLWGKVVVNVTSAPKSVTVTNTGSSTLNIINISVSGDFALATSTKPCGNTLAAGVSCVIKVTFTPTQLGTRTGMLTITDNASNSPQGVSLSGTGGPPASITPATATYASQTVGTSSLAKVFTLTNYLSAALSGVAISISGDFSISTTTCTTSLAAKSKCTISVVFHPSSVGTRTGQLSVSDSASNSPQTSQLKGVGK
jgi:hypothetical protein